MELKKSPKADLNNKKSIFILFGIAVAMLLVIWMFSVSESEQKLEQMSTEMVAAEQEVTEVTVQEEQKQPEPEKAKPMLASEIINIVKDDAKIDHDMSIFDEMTDIDLNTEVKYGGDLAAEEVVDEEPVVFAEETATFDGKPGQSAFSAWCQANIKYPTIAQDNGIQGRVTVSFVVEPNGKLTNIKLVRGVEKSLDQAALDIVAKSPAKWVAAKNNGRPVRLMINMPIIFKLQ